jgi:hypothetical protein
MVQFCCVPHFCTVSKDPPLPADATSQKPLQTYINELFKNMISKQRKPNFFTTNNQHPLAIYSGGTKHLSTNSFYGNSHTVSSSKMDYSSININGVALAALPVFSIKYMRLLLLGQYLSANPNTIQEGGTLL